MKKGATVGNITTIYKPMSWFEQMSYSDLLAERKFLRSEITRFQKASENLGKCDRRGMFQEIHECFEKINNMISSCEWGINECQKEMIKRMQDRQ